MQRKLLKPQIVKLLSTPRKVLNARLVYGKSNIEVLGLLDDDVNYKISGRVPEGILLQLHQKIRKTRSENHIWSSVLWHLRHPLPGEIAHDLLDRKIAVSALGHSRQDDDVQWRMAAFFDEALLTLAKDRYCKRRYSVSEFQRVLDFKPTHNWMFESLAHAEASSKAKVQAFLAAARQHPEAERILQTHELMSDGWRWWKEQAKEKAAQHARHLKQAASPEITDEEARELCQAQDQDICKTLIKNPHISDSMLQEMTRLRHFQGVPHVRGAAKSELHRREQKRSLNKDSAQI